jgi:DNA recombination protein RmuC
VLESSGLRLGEEYVREQNHKAEDGQNYRPDVIINLPEGKHIVVDAKVSLNAYNDFINEEDENLKSQYLKQHIDAIRNHIKSLSAKAYQQLPSLHCPDFVFMFMPIEPAFMTAFQHDEKLFMDAFDQKIVVVTPTTLLASLRTVESLWAIERRGKSADELAQHAAKVYDRLRIVVEKMDKLGSQLNSAQKTYDETYSSLAQGRGNLVNTANQFVELGVRIKKEIPKSIVEKAQ